MSMFLTHFYVYFRYLTTEIVLLDSTSQLLKLNKADIMAAVLYVTQQIHGEFGAAAIMNGLSGKKTFVLILILIR